MVILAILPFKSVSRPHRKQSQIYRTPNDITGDKNINTQRDRITARVNGSADNIFVEMRIQMFSLCKSIHSRHFR